jgi:hypothetical protein
MPTVIDSLVVELALDARKLNEGTRQALEDFRKTQEQTRRYANEAESQGKKLYEFFSDFKRQAIGLTTLFLGGMGVKEFVGHMTNLEAAAGRVAKTMDVSVEELTAWQGAARQMGGTTEGITGTLQNLSSEVNKFRLTGQTGLLAPLTQLGVSLYAANGQLKTSTQLFMDIADAVQSMDPAQARAMLSLLGMDQDAINLALKTHAERQKLLDDQKQALIITKEESAAAQELQTSWSLFADTARNVGKALLGDMAPGMKAVLDYARELIQEYPNVAKAVAAIGTAASSVLAGRMLLGAKRMITGGGGAAAGGGGEAAAGEAVAGSFLGRFAGIAGRWILGPLGWYFASTKEAGESDEAEAARREPEAATGAANQLELSKRRGVGPLSLGGDGSQNWTNFLAGLSYLETSQRGGGNSKSSAQGFFQFLTGTAADASEAGLGDPRFGSYEQQADATRKFIEKFHPAAAAAIARGDFAAAAAMLNKRWPSLPGGSQSQSPERYRTYEEELQGGGPRPPIGAPAAAVGDHSSSIDSRSSTSSTDRSTKIDIGEVNIHAPGAKNAEEIAAEIPGQIKRSAAIGSWNSGLA